MDIRQHFNFSQALNTDFSFSRQLSAFGSKSAGGQGSTAGQATPASGQDEYQFTLTDTAPSLTTVVASDVHQPFGTSGFFFVERYPEIAFTTTSARLLPTVKVPSGQSTIGTSGWGFLRQSPINLSLTLGHYRELPTNTRLNRLDAALDGAIQQHPILSGLLFGTNARFEQKLTSDGTAQYVVDLNSTALRALSRSSTINLNYNRIQPVGYSPFQFDRPGNINMSDLGVDLGLGQQPGAITTVANPGALGYLSAIGGMGFNQGYASYGSSFGSYGGNYGGYGGYGGNGGYGAYGSYGGMGYPGQPGFVNLLPGQNGRPLQPAFHLSLHTGYDFNAGRRGAFGEQKWVPLNIDLVAYPTKRVTFYASTTYDLNPHDTAVFGTQGPLSPIRGGTPMDRWRQPLHRHQLRL